MTLGQYIKELRRQRHLTQRQLAEKLDRSDTDLLGGVA